MNENTKDNGATANGAEESMLAIIAHPNAVKAMEVLVKAAQCKDAFADSYAELVAAIPAVRDMLADYDKVKAFVSFMLTYRGVNCKDKTRRESNRIAYVKTQSSIALAEKLGIDLPAPKETDWEYAAWLSKVMDTITLHKVNVDTFVHDITHPKA